MVKLYNATKIYFVNKPQKRTFWNEIREQGTQKNFSIDTNSLLATK
jgi:hypothetical protein